MSEVDTYWGNVTVCDRPFSSVADSLAFLENRFAGYPLFRELSGFWGDWAGKRILDYGCGPGHDLVGFLHHGKASMVVGLDVSQKALRLADHRLCLHGFGFRSRELMRVSDDDARLPFPDRFFHHVNCQGVLHHTSHPKELLAEFYRVLKPGGTAGVMIYNRDSLFYHLEAAWMHGARRGDFRPTEEIFRGLTDGPACPVSLALSPDKFLPMCKAAGFEATFRGGHFSGSELNYYRDHKAAALADDRLTEEHKAFMREVETADGFPQYRGKPCGIGGHYWLERVGK